ATRDPYRNLPHPPPRGKTTRGDEAAGSGAERSARGRHFVGWGGGAINLAPLRVAREADDRSPHQSSTVSSKILRAMDAPRIILFSTPLVSTWVFDETHRILFDAGDGVTALLDSKIHKIRLAAITHTHRDHCAGLMQLLNLRGGAGDFT